MMIFANLKENGKTDSWLFDSWADYHAMTFSPETETVCCCPLTVHGKTYAERRESLRDLAIDLQREQSEADGLCLSCRESADLYAWLEKKARRFGLLTEFRENCIC